ncbi:MAG: ATP-binding protein [Pseudomonadota bacterium]
MNNPMRKEEALSPQQASETISQRLEVVGQLAAGIAHEINTPVQFIGDNLRYLSSQTDILIGLVHRYQKLSELIEGDDVLRSRYEEIKTFSTENEVDFLVEDLPSAISDSMLGVESISAIVRSIKSLVNPGDQNKIATDVNKAIETAITISRGSWKHTLDLRTELEDDLPAVSCHSGELDQVIINLIVNAAHAIESTGQHGEVCVRSFRYKSSIGIQVQDSGSGIPAEIQHKIFDPFFSSKGVGKGTGQGLSFSHSSIVDRSGGTLFFETEEGQGTTFHIYLPVHDDNLSNGEDAV